jgi:hypothetical protein
VVLCGAMMKQHYCSKAILENIKLVANMIANGNIKGPTELLAFQEMAEDVVEWL